MEIISFPHSCMSFFFFFNHTSDIKWQARAPFIGKIKFFDRYYANTPRNGPHSTFGASNGQHKVLTECLKCSWRSPLLTPFPQRGCTMQDAWFKVLVLSQILNPVTAENTELLDDVCPTVWELLGVLNHHQFCTMTSYFKVTKQVN